MNNMNSEDEMAIVIAALRERTVKLEKDGIDCQDPKEAKTIENDRLKTQKILDMVTDTRYGSWVLYLP